MDRTDAIRRVRALAAVTVERGATEAEAASAAAAAQRIVERYGLDRGLPDPSLEAPARPPGWVGAWPPPYPPEGAAWFGFGDVHGSITIIFG